MDTVFFPCCNDSIFPSTSDRCFLPVSLYLPSQATLLAAEDHFLSRFPQFHFRFPPRLFPLHAGKHFSLPMLHLYVLPAFPPVLTALQFSLVCSFPSSSFTSDPASQPAFPCQIPCLPENPFLFPSVRPHHLTAVTLARRDPKARHELGMPGHCPCPGTCYVEKSR